jgi:hypothetical protein
LLLSSKRLREAQQRSRLAAAGRIGSPRHIEETRAYLRDFNQVVAKTSTAINLYEKMLALHPNRVNPGSLWATAKALKGNAASSA